ncbi:MAG: hypothetical protein NC336_06685 [Clostridium sp.]|nr:hypothetical protein [Clostridium sp.]
MNKFLLTVAAAAVSASLASAESVTYNMSDLEESQVTGEYHETTYKEDQSVQAYANWQPIESINLGDYTLTFVQNNEKNNKPALYTAKTGSAWTIRLYKECTMTVTAKNNVTFRNINFYSDKNDVPTITASVGTGEFNSTTKVYSWSSDKAVSSVTLTFGSASKTFRITSIEFTDEAPVVKEPTKAATVSDLLNVTNGDKFSFEGSLTVAYANGPDCYVYDETGATLLYSNKQDPWAAVLPAGTVITKFEGIRSDYNTTVEFIPTMSTLVTEGTTEVIAATCLSADDVDALDIDTYVLLRNATFAVDPDNARYATATLENGSEVKLYNRFTTNSYEVVTFPEYGKYNIYGLRSAYSGEMQVNFVKAEATTAIESVEAAEADAPAVFYNLQGVRVANPANGLFIKVQGNKTSKVIL